MSFKVGVKTKTDTSWVFNALRFGTRKDAEAYAKDLFRRWTAVTEYSVVESGDEPNATFPVPSETFKVQEKLHSVRSQEHTSELQSPDHLVCRLLLDKKNL